jgi:hypothetical protein
MAEQARVISIDAIREFKAALGEFAEQAGNALSEAQSDVQRTIWWISNDRLAHWQREIRKRTDKLNQAKAELFKKQLESQDTRTSAVVERKHVAKAQAALNEAEEKLRRVKKWSFALERELMLFRAGCGQISTAVQGDVPQALGRMDKMINSLEAYLRVTAPQDDAPTTSDASRDEDLSPQEQESSIKTTEGQP